ncbi:GMP reductase domain protein, partial [Vibrio harveyi]
SPETFYP